MIPKKNWVTVGWLVNTHDSSQDNIERNEGEITENVLPVRNRDELRYPPFLPFTFDDIENVFPTDVFFSHKESDAYLLGTQVIDGVEYYVMEIRVIKPGGLFQFQDENINYCSVSVHRAWIDINRGCIPVRIEYLSALSKDGQLVEYTPSLQFSEPSRTVFEVQEIQRYGTGFYPAKASHRFMGTSINTLIRLQEILDSVNTNNDADVEGDSLADLDFSLEVYSEIKWDVTDVILDVVINRETIVLPFPKRTVIFDDRTDKIRLAGMTEKEFEQMLLEQSRSFGVVPDSGMVFPDPDSKWTPEDFIPRPPQGKGATFFIIGVNLIVLAFILRYILLSIKQRRKKK